MYEDLTNEEMIAALTECWTESWSHTSWSMTSSEVSQVEVFLSRLAELIKDRA